MAEKRFHVDINLLGNQLKKFIVETLASHPTPYGEGHMYYNSTDKVVYSYNGTSWTSGGNILLTGDVVTDGAGVATIQALSIDTGMLQDDSVVNAKLANMAAATIKGSIGGGDPTDLNPASIRTIINVADGAQANVATDLTYDLAAATVTIISSTGADTIIPAATLINAGIMTAADVVTLAKVINATETTEGLARNATDAEIVAGTEDSESVFVNPKQLSDAVAAGVGIPVGSDNATIWEGTVGTSLSSIMNHSLNTTNVQVQVKRTAAPYDIVETVTEITDADNVTVYFNTNPTAGEYTVSVVGG